MIARLLLLLCLVPQIIIHRTYASPPEQEARSAVLAWLSEPPWYDPDQQARQPGFRYEDWLARGRKLPRLVESLVAILNAQDPFEPRDASMQATYALISVGNKSSAVSEALVRMLHNRWPLTSIHAAVALGTQADARGLKALEAIVADKTADGNTRGNAALSIATLAPREARALLQGEADDPEPIVRRCVARALKELAQ